MTAQAAATARAVAGIDIGGTKILGVVIDPEVPDRVLAEYRVSTPQGGPAILAGVDAVLAELRDQCMRSGVKVEVDSVGVGVAGLVDKAGVLHMGPHLPELRKEPLRAKLEDRLALPVAVDNDGTCAAWGEHRAGAARNARDSLTVALGTGIGAGLVAGGQVVRGGHGFAGEAGHMVVDPTGPVCPCGRRGCWERFGSGSGLGRLAREAAEAGRLDGALALVGGDSTAVRGEHVGILAHRNDADAIKLLDDFAWWVAVGLANLVTLVDPEVVVVAGGLVGIGRPLMVPVRQHYENLVMAADARSDTLIVAAQLGERAGAIGAALLR